MNMSSYNPLLVAPRPVRLTSVHSHGYHSKSFPVRLVSASTEQMDKLKIEGDDIDDNTQSMGGRFEGSSGSAPDNGFSPRTPSRSSLPSEALEEFLSILRPSFLPPSPTRHLRRASGTSSVPAIGYHLKRAKLELVQQQKASELHGVEETERPSSTQLLTSYTSDSPTSDDEEVCDIPANRWLDTASLSSPISRTLTRNPFQRHPSYELPSQSPSSCQSAGSAPLSPSAVPLPSPTPGELVIEVI